MISNSYINSLDANAPNIWRYEYLIRLEKKKKKRKKKVPPNGIRTRVHCITVRLHTPLGQALLQSNMVLMQHINL